MSTGIAPHAPSRALTVTTSVFCGKCDPLSLVWAQCERATDLGFQKVRQKATKFSKKFAHASQGYTLGEPAPERWMSRNLIHVTPTIAAAGNRLSPPERHSVRLNSLLRPDPVLGGLSFFFAARATTEKRGNRIEAPSCHSQPKNDNFNQFRAGGPKPGFRLSAANPKRLWAGWMS